MQLTLVYGDDDYRILEAARQAVGKALEGGNRDFGLDELEASNVDPAQLESLLHSPPMMGNVRVVRIDRANQLSGKVEELIGEEAQRDNPNTRVVLVYEPEKNPPQKLHQQAAQKHKAGRFRWREAKSWIQEYARQEHDLQLTPAASQLLLESLGHRDGGRLAHEIDRLALMVEGDTIDRDTVSFATGSQQGHSVFDLCDRVGEKKFGQARNALRDVLNQHDQHGVGVIISLSRHLTRLSLIRARVDQGQNPRDAGSQFGWLKKKLGRQVQNWSQPELDRALARLGEADLAIKDGDSQLQALTRFLQHTLQADRAKATTRIR